MKPMTGGMLDRLLEQQGWILLRIRGSHHIYGKQGFREKISIPIHGDKPLKVGLLKHFLNVTGINKTEIE